MNSLDMEKMVNLPALMIKHMKRVTSLKTNSWSSLWLYALYSLYDLWVPLGKGISSTRKDKITNLTIDECDHLVENHIGKRSSRIMTQILLDLDATDKRLLY